jgi:two-component system chemotaxis sensor kinase CheA
MDVVKTNIQKLNGSVEIRSEPGKGSVFIISLPLTLAILPVLLVLLGDQPFALPLSMVREILPIEKVVCRKWAARKRWWCAAKFCRSSPCRMLGWPQLQIRNTASLCRRPSAASFLAVIALPGAMMP